MGGFPLRPLVIGIVDESSSVEVLMFEEPSIKPLGHLAGKNVIGAGKGHICRSVLELLLQPQRDPQTNHLPISFPILWPLLRNQPARMSPAQDAKVSVLPLVHSSMSVCVSDRVFVLYILHRPGNFNSGGSVLAQLKSPVKITCKRGSTRI